MTRSFGNVSRWRPGAPRSSPCPSCCWCPPCGTSELTCGLRLTLSQKPACVTGGTRNSTDSVPALMALIVSEPAGLCGARTGRHRAARRAGGHVPLLRRVAGAQQAPAVAGPLPAGGGRLQRWAAADLRGAHAVLVRRPGPGTVCTLLRYFAHIAQRKLAISQCCLH